MKEVTVVSTSMVLEWLVVNPGQAILVFCCCWILLFFARSAVHGLLLVLASWVSRSLRHTAKMLDLWLGRIHSRNQEVLVHQSIQLQEYLIEREFQRINGIVTNDLSGYPTLQKAIANQIALIEDDYKKCSLEPEPAPEWVDALVAIVELKKTQEGNPALLKILADIHDSVVSLQKKSLGDYRDAVAQKHRLLHAMMPHWRRLNNSVSGVGGKIKGIIEHAATVDRYMRDYEEIRNQGDKVNRQLFTSVSSRFVRDCLLLAAGAAGVALNLVLISTHVAGAIPTTDSVSFIYSPQFSAIALVLVQMLASVMLLELLRATHMFVGLGRLTEQLRKRLIWAFMLLLLGLAVAESLIMLVKPVSGMPQIINIFATTNDTMDAELELLPIIPQMILGFVLPLALTVVMIPFESVIRDARVIFGRMVEYLFMAMIAILRFTAQHVSALLRLGIPLFDLLIFLPLWIDRLVREKSHEIKTKGARKTEELPVTGGVFLRKD